ncbi:type I methionyl aminopeptidase [Paenibacillus albiflavus]|uniref:Methionine aminopeptidase n=1 Tax=Paenibacillus albiflavus TaxID=2545760 RepID=A0A4R4E8A5_9BACL|nr:type I methionyl aminopeptidase [Paenibacillus albiflavus]TCZ74331.1 type I methionyl aminopeptidase [Paenibacillus albiflavus]
MIILKSNDEIRKLKEAGEVVAACHKEIAGMMKPGVTTHEINDKVVKIINKLGAKQVIKGYRGFPAETCASVNDVIAHGFPNDTPLLNGDIVTIDIVAELDGWIGDSAWTYAIGDISDEAKRLMRVTKEALYKGIEKSIAGNRLGDVQHAVQSHAEKNGFSVVRELYAHGVGRNLHEDPGYPHVGMPGKGIKLREGMVFTIEPMINVGTYLMTIDDDNWTTRTFDGKLSAQYEHTIAITSNGPLILTDQDH